MQKVSGKNGFLHLVPSFEVGSMASGPSALHISYLRCLAVAPCTQTCPRSQIALLFFLAAKVGSYGASANLHLVGFTTEKEFHAANAVDWSLIAWNAWGTVIAPHFLLRCLDDFSLQAVNSSSFFQSLLTYYSVRKTGIASLCGDIKKYDCIQKGTKGCYGTTPCAMRVEGPCTGLTFSCGAKALAVCLGIYLWQISNIPLSRRPQFLFWHSRYWGGYEDFHFFILIFDILQYASLAENGMGRLF